MGAMAVGLGLVAGGLLLGGFVATHGADDMPFDGVFRDADNGGDLFVAVAVLAVQQKDLPALVGQAVDGFLQ